jgi:hypothetical protein
MSYLEIIVLGFIFNIIVVFSISLLLILESLITNNNKDPQFVFMVMSLEKLNARNRFLMSNIKTLKKYKFHELLPYVSLIFVFKLIINMFKGIHPVQTLYNNIKNESDRLEKLYKSENIK